MIYDLQIDKAYTLNETSRIVYKSCNGETTFEDLRSRFKFTDDFIYLALDELATSNLIENYQSNHCAGLSRREVIKKSGWRRWRRSRSLPPSSPPLPLQPYH